MTSFGITPQTLETLNDYSHRQASQLDNDPPSSSPPNFHPTNLTPIIDAIERQAQDIAGLSRYCTVLREILRETTGLDSLEYQRHEAEIFERLYPSPKDDAVSQDELHQTLVDMEQRIRSDMTNTITETMRGILKELTGEKSEARDSQPQTPTPNSQAPHPKPQTPTPHTHSLAPGEQPYDPNAPAPEAQDTFEPLQKPSRKSKKPPRNNKEGRRSDDDGAQTRD